MPPFPPLLSLALALALALGGPAHGALCPSLVRAPAPLFPVSSLPGHLLPQGAAGQWTQEHWSEGVTLPRPGRTDVAQGRVNCPDEDGGLVLWETLGFAPGQNVTLPDNTAVLFHACSVPQGARFGVVTVPATAKLVLRDEVNVHLEAAALMVQGELLVGSPTCRTRSNVTITIFGNNRTQALPGPPFTDFGDPVYKGLVVKSGGKLDLHGSRFFPTWTRLARTAQAGDTVIFLQDVPNWDVGSEIVVTTTELKDSRDYNHNDVVTVQAVYLVPSVGPNVAAVVVSPPLQYLHYGGREYQAEVLLLSRRIRVQGDEVDSEPTNPSAPISCKDASSASTYPCPSSFTDGFGVHIMITGHTSRARISGLHVFRGGQTNILGRYPIHYHLAGPQPDSYVTDSSVTRSYFRGFAIHGTSLVRLQENTAYDVIGHCMFVAEDGVEEGNHILYNAIAHVHMLGPFIDHTLAGFGSQELPWVDQSLSLMLPSDVTASCFYGTNMNNTWVGNAASGGWSGFAFPSLPVPIGLHKDVKAFSPKNRPLREFRGNSAHSTGFWYQSAGGVYVGGELRFKTSSPTSVLEYTGGRSASHDTCSDPAAGTAEGSGGCWDEAKQVWVRLEDTKVFLANRGLQDWGNRLEVKRFEVTDTGMSFNVFGEVSVSGMLLTCRSDGHKPSWFAGCSAAGLPRANVPWGVCHSRDFTFWNTFAGLQWYDTGQRHIVVNSTFRNCEMSWSGPCVYQSDWRVNLCQAPALWILLTHSDEFVPQVMQVTAGIRYDRVNTTKLMRFSTSRTDVRGVTVSGRLQSWLDQDGSASRVHPLGTVVQLGSAWANDWWRTNDNCKLVDEMWACPLASPRDSQASFVFEWDITAQTTQIGGNKAYCWNGQDGQHPCPIVATVTAFGRRESTDALYVGMNARVTGPLLEASSFGWFVRFVKGTPRVLSLQNMQLRHNDTLILALPYPAGTMFDIKYVGQSGCNPGYDTVCEHGFVQVNSLAEVRDGFGDLYFFSPTLKMLFLRVVQRTGNFRWRNNHPDSRSPWTTTFPVSVFQREGLGLVRDVYGSPGGSHGGKITITATTCPTPLCPPLPDVCVPPASVVNTAVAKAPTRKPTRLPTRVPTRLPTAPSRSPRRSPTVRPGAPTGRPSTRAPTVRPSTGTPTRKPTKAPSQKPTSKAPTRKPTSRAPTRKPTKAPTRKPTTKQPTSRPSKKPSLHPTARPTSVPTKQGVLKAPTVRPTTAVPTQRPTTAAPTMVPNQCA